MSSNLNWVMHLRCANRAAGRSGEERLPNTLTGRGEEINLAQQLDLQDLIAEIVHPANHPTESVS